MQGAFDSLGERFPTKKSMREAAEKRETINLEATSLFGNEYDGPAQDASNGTYFVVGPDPHRSRKWYAQVIVRDGSVTVK
jgi:hypothetical protein